METKICTKCNIENPATLEFWHKQKHGKYGLKSTCKKCELKRNKKYRSTPEAKENHRKWMAKWRAENPKETLRVSRKSYKKNAVKINAIRKEKYRTDPIYKAECFERERKYKESGRRYEVGHTPEQMEKARIRSKKRRLNPVKKAHDYKRNGKWRDDNREYINEMDKKRRKELCPAYIAYCMRVSVKDLTPEIIETKRKIIQIKRELKTNNIKIR